jgi:urea transport system ATP-binding protein
MNENPMVPDLALPEQPAETALSGVASMGHAVVPGEIDTSHGTILYLDDVTVSFDGFRALNALTLSIDAGELRCIIGPNGAGKTTMMDVITGKTRPDAGKVFLGQSIDLTRMKTSNWQ